MSLSNDPLIHGHPRYATESELIANAAADVQGPDSATDGNLAVFDGADGKKLKDGGAVPTGGSGFVYQTQKILNHSQITHLPTAAVEVIPAPGENILLIPTVAVMRMNWVADYTNINASCLIKLDVAGSLLRVLAEDTLAGVTNLIAGGGDDGTIVVVTLNSLARSNVTTVTPAINPHFHNGAVDSGFYDSDIVNLPLQISALNGGDGDFADGDSGNTLIIGVTYMKFNIVTGVFI